MRGLLALVLIGACREAPPPPPATPAVPPPAADSLVLTLPGGTTVWRIPGRTGVSATGATCDEWSIELRNGTARHLVPLLYTRTGPRLEQGTLVATLSNHCLDGPTYVIDPVTAYPTPRGPR